MTPIPTHENKQALLHFISAAQAGRFKSASKQQKTAFRLAVLLHELEFDFSSFPDSETAGFLELTRLLAGRPIWDKQKIRASMLVAAAVKLPDSPENLPLWKRMQINTKLNQQLVEKICDPVSTTIGGQSREDFDSQSRVWSLF